MNDFLLRILITLIIGVISYVNSVTYDKMSPEERIRQGIDKRLISYKNLISPVGILGMVVDVFALSAYILAFYWHPKGIDIIMWADKGIVSLGIIEVILCGIPMILGYKRRSY